MAWRAQSLGVPLDRDALARAALWFACTFTCVHVLYSIGYEGRWYRLEDAMSFHTDPPFRHRVLFVWLANAVQDVAPAFRPARCYFVTQIVAAAIAFWAIQPWTARMVGERLAAFSRPLLLMLLVPTFTYWTFYDIGIVATFALALWAMTERRWGAYLAILAIGTFNHENTLLLIPLAARVRAGSWRIGAAGARWVALQIALYAGVRALLFLFLPVDRAWQGKLAYNLALLSDPAALMRTVALLGAWSIVAIAGWRRLPREAALAIAVLGPGLLAIALVVGQVNELRLFNALLPVFAVVILSTFGGTRIQTDS